MINLTLESKNDKIRIDDSFWEFVKNNKVDELASFILGKYIKYIGTYLENNDDKLNKYDLHILDYFSIIDSDKAMTSLYNELNNELSAKVLNRVIRVITETKLIDYSKIISLIKHTEFYVQKTGLLLSQSEKLNYEKADIQLLDNLVNLIHKVFSQRGKNTTKKKALSSKEKEIWICECKKENDKESEYCSNCHKDIYGFGDREAKPSIVVEKLKNKVELLKEMIG